MTTMTDLDKKLDALIEKITQRNAAVQNKKSDGPGSWVVAVVLALVSLVGIGVAMYLASRRAKELAKARTQIEHDRIDQDARAHEIRKTTLLKDRNDLINEILVYESAIQEREQALKRAEQEHAERKKKLEGLKAWGEINET
jgi:uncharacterized protein HemX